MEMESYTKLGSTVKKGAWTREEDELLKQCVQSHGEGKWHLVPYKAGLRRCRKSCRLRWLNYLKPDIKRGDFSEDEVDLLIRLHKLLGNRWSLIAGRLPGRTANDVKNYWNTRLSINSRFKKMKSVSQETTKTAVIRPQPRTFIKTSSSLRDKEPTLARIESDGNMSMASHASPMNEDNNWWETFFDDKDGTFSCFWLEEEMLTGFWLDEMPHSTRSDLPFNVDVWNHSKDGEGK